MFVIFLKIAVIVVIVVIVVIDECGMILNVNMSPIRFMFVYDRLCYLFLESRVQQFVRLLTNESEWVIDMMLLESKPSRLSW